MALIPEPRRLNPLLRLGIAASERVTGRRMVPARLLAWAPRQAVGAGVMEALVAHDVPSTRILRLVRLTASFVVGCSFCIDLNAHERDREGVTDAELDALRSLARGEGPDAAGAAPTGPGEGPDAAGAAPARRGEGPDAAGAAPAGPGENPDAAGAAPTGPGEGPDAAGAAPTGRGADAARLAATFPDVRERLAVAYAQRVSLTPPDLPESFASELTRHFTETELVTLAATIAQVNFWARFNQALGVPPAGFTDLCRLSERA